MTGAIRLFRDDDAGALTAVTVAAIRQTGLRAYSPAQVAAWAARHPGPQRFIASAAKGDTILIAVDGADHPLAYALLEADGHLDMLYCHPHHTGQGLAGKLLAKTDSHAKAAGIACLFTEASELARPVFVRAGYALLHRRDFTIPSADGDISIHNYAMEKRFG
jgi:putative acetyltransferase